MGLDQCQASPRSPFLHLVRHAACHRSYNYLPRTLHFAVTTAFVAWPRHALFATSIAGGLHSQDEGNTLLKEDDSLLRHTFFSILRDHHPSIAAKVSVTAFGKAYLCD